MSKVTTGLYVGDLYTSHRLFDSAPYPTLSSQSADNPHSSERIQGVISACFDVPRWCCRSKSHFYKDGSYENDAFQQLCRSQHYDQSYINLHVDRIPHNSGDHDASGSPSSPSSSDGKGGSGRGRRKGSTFVLHAIIQAEDGPNECLFRAFSFTYDFIEAVRTLEKASTYIHCMMGMSRSCSLVSSYLMKKQRQPYSSVIKQLKAVHPIASPSPGFICQLILYRKHGFDITNNNQFWAEYRRLLHTINLSKLEDYESPDDGTQCDEAENCAVYSCMKCRQTLFYGANVIRHNGANNGGPGDPCSSVFVEPMDWMTGVDSQSGKISCKNQHCSSKLGYYCWYGRRCSCGHLQVPAFQIQLSKVDKLITESRLGGRTPVRNEDLL